MAQLVKLSNYISRYEDDLTRYSTQFIRLKKQHWNGLKYRWETGDKSLLLGNEPIEMTEQRAVERNRVRAFWHKWPFKKEQAIEENLTYENVDEVDFQLEFMYLPDTIEGLRQSYLDQLFQFQMNWSSSSPQVLSQVAPSYLRDSFLRELAQQLPDQYFIFYQPIMLVQKAPVELDIMIVTPIECLLVTVIEEENLAVFTEDTQRFWMKHVGNREEKVLNPMIALHRMSKIVAQLLTLEEIDLPIRKCLVSRNGYIDDVYGGPELEVVDRRRYRQWLNTLKKEQAPFKYNQFRLVQSLLKRMETHSMECLY